MGPLDAVALPTPALLGTECPVLPPADLTSPGSAAEGLYAKGQGRTAERLQVGTLGGLLVRSECFAKVSMMLLSQLTWYLVVLGIFV